MTKREIKVLMAQIFALEETITEIATDDETPWTIKDGKIRNLYDQCNSCWLYLREKKKEDLE